MHRRLNLFNARDKADSSPQLGLSQSLPVSPDGSDLFNLSKIFRIACAQRCYYILEKSKIDLI